MNDKAFTYCKHASTNICLETPSSDNPFLTEKRYLAGFDIETLTAKCSFIETLYLLFKQELPSEQESTLLNALFVGLINAGPRDEAIRASMAAGVSKTRPEHLLPIGLNIIGGVNNGAQTIEHAYHFISQQVNKTKTERGTLDTQKLSSELSYLLNHIYKNGNVELDLCAKHIPGFSQHYGSIDTLTARLMKSMFAISPDSDVFIWCEAFNSELNKHQLGITPVGLASAIFSQLKLGARESVGLYQLLRAPGILAHGMEQTHKPITAIPMLQDDDYHFVIPNEGIDNA